MPPFYLDRLAERVAAMAGVNGGEQREEEGGVVAEGDVDEVEQEGEALGLGGGVAGAALEEGEGGGRVKIRGRL